MQNDKYTKDLAIAEFVKYSEKQQENYLTTEVDITITDQPDDAVEVHMSVPYLGCKVCF